MFYIHHSPKWLAHEFFIVVVVFDLQQYMDIMTLHINVSPFFINSGM